MQYIELQSMQQWSIGHTRDMPGACSSVINLFSRISNMWNQRTQFKDWTLLYLSCAHCSRQIWIFNDLIAMANIQTKAYTQGDKSVPSTRPQGELRIKYTVCLLCCDRSSGNIIDRMTMTSFDKYYLCSVLPPPCCGYTLCSVNATK